jgi:phosphoribosylglycinamide formyltransferase 1
MKNIAIFASGSGTNAENIIKFFLGHDKIRVSMVLTNNKDAGVLQRAIKHNLPCVVFDRNDFYNTTLVPDILKENSIDFIVLAGFLWLVPKDLIHSFKGRLVNIHPALLPSYGGKGMYGMNVHEKVLENGEKESGITIHLVNEEYDKGDILFQARCPVLPGDTPETLSERIHLLEYTHYPVVIREYIERDR